MIYLLSSFSIQDSGRLYNLTLKSIGLPNPSPIRRTWKFLTWSADAFDTARLGVYIDLSSLSLIWKSYCIVLADSDTVIETGLLFVELNQVIQRLVLRTIYFAKCVFLPAPFNHHIRSLVPVCLRIDSMQFGHCIIILLYLQNLFHFCEL